MPIFLTLLKFIVEMMCIIICSVINYIKVGDDRVRVTDIHKENHLKTKSSIHKSSESI